MGRKRVVNRETPQNGLPYQVHTGKPKMLTVMRRTADPS